MISYKIEDDVHEIVCDIEDELLQSKSEKPLNYTNGHTVIFGSDEFPLEAVNVPLPTLSTKSTKLEGDLDFENDLFMGNKFPNIDEYFPHGIGDIVFENDVFTTSKEILERMKKETIVCKYDPRYDTNTVSCIDKCQTNDACNINICNTALTTRKVRHTILLVYDPAVSSAPWEP